MQPVQRSSWKEIFCHLLEKGEKMFIQLGHYTIQTDNILFVFRMENDDVHINFVGDQKILLTAAEAQIFFKELEKLR